MCYQMMLIADDKEKDDIEFQAKIHGAKFKHGKLQRMQRIEKEEELDDYDSSLIDKLANEDFKDMQDKWAKQHSS